MRVTSGHECEIAGCEGLAVYGFKFNGDIRWACSAHRAHIGFIDRPAAQPSGAATAGLQADISGAMGPPAAAHQPGQARLL